MYKTKIRDWGIGKRLRDEDIIAILFLKYQKREEPANVEFWVRGYRVNDDNIRRYLRRKPKLLAQFRDGREPASDDLAHVTCVARQPAPWILSPSRAKSPEQDAEAFMFNCKDYLEGALSSGKWIIDEAGVCVSREGGPRGSMIGKTVQTHFYTAVDSLNRSDFSEAFKVLDISFQSTGNALRLEIPRVLALIMNIAQLLDRKKQPEVLKVFLKYMRSQSQSLFGTHHGMAKVVDGIARIDVSAYREVFERVFLLLIDQSDALLGTDSSLSFELFWDFFCTLMVTESHQDQVGALTNQLAKVDLSRRERPWVIRIERLLAWKVAFWKANEGKRDEATRALQTAAETLSPASDADVDGDWPRHWLCAGKVFVALHDLPEAERSYVAGAKAGEAYGKDEDCLQVILDLLAQTLDMQHKPLEAVRVRDYARSRLQNIAAQVDWDWEEFARRTAEERLPALDDADD
jgi:hypothetical protein